MSDLVLLSRAHMRRIERFFPRSRGLVRVDDRRVISGIIYVTRHGLQWKDAPGGYGPHKTLYLADEDVVRLILDDTMVCVRLDRRTTSMSLLVVLGEQRDGQKVLLSVGNMGG